MRIPSNPAREQKQGITISDFIAFGLITLIPAVVTTWLLLPILALEDCVFLTLGGQILAVFGFQLEYLILLGCLQISLFMVAFAVGMLYRTIVRGFRVGAKL